MSKAPSEFVSHIPAATIDKKCITEGCENMRLPALSKCRTCRSRYQRDRAREKAAAKKLAAQATVQEKQNEPTIQR